MGWLSNLVQNRELNRLEELIQTTPAPSLFLRLSQMYAEAGDEGKSRRIIEQGLERFPDDPTLTEATADFDRTARTAEIEQLKHRIEQFPNPSLYIKLAELYLSLDAPEECVSTCHMALKNYPEYGGTYVTLAKISLSKRDHDQALEHLQKATELDKYNHTGMLLLAHEYLRRGERDPARSCLTNILGFAPGDEQANQMLKNFDQLAEEALAEAAGGLTAKAKTRLEKVQDLVHEASHSVPSGPAAATQEDSASPLQRELKALTATAGVQGGLLVDSHGLVIGSEMPEGQDEELAAALITSIFRSSMECTDDFGLGQMEEMSLETETGSIHLLNLEELMVAVIATAGTKAGLLQRALHTFAEKVLSGS
ncbi:MAG: roadblock/LC7 domain-containing protein [Planctomycetota bacterium]|jgi:predicted regulator of Ras-like GTPase activity (Roadblock/LC7/MglB family)